MATEVKHMHIHMCVWISVDFNCENIKTWSVDIKDLLVRTKKNKKKRRRKYYLNSGFNISLQ